MDRRSFLAVAGSTALSGSAFITGPSAHAATIQHNTETEEGRFFFCRDMLSRLCTDLGPRPAGSASFEKGIHIIRDDMAASCVSAELDHYTYEKWELVGEPIFRTGDVTLDGYPFHGCSGTPKDGIRGVLKKADSGGYPFMVTDRSTGKMSAYVSISSYGAGIPRSAYRREEKTHTIIGLGKYDVPSLDRAAESGTPVFIRAVTKFTPDFPSWNAVGTIPGRTSKEILFLAHADTVYPSPGANDNTASVIVMLMIARAFSDLQQEYTLRFVAAGNEEYGTFGARHYAERRMREGTMKDIRFIVQFDSLTYGPNLLLTSNDARLRSLVETINKDLGVAGTPRHIESDAYVMDAEPFKPSGARAIYINSRGYDGITLPVYHRPEDVPETVGFDCVDSSFRVFTEYIRRVQNIGG